MLLSKKTQIRNIRTYEGDGGEKEGCGQKAGGNEIWGTVYSRNFNIGNILIYFIVLIWGEIYIIIFIGAENMFNQIKKLCSIKILNKIDINRYFFNMAKWIDLSSKSNILLHGGT